MKKWLLAISVLMFGAVFSAGAAEAVYSYSLSWGGLNHPNSVAVDSSGNVYVADTNEGGFFVLNHTHITTRQRHFAPKSQYKGF